MPIISEETRYQLLRQLEINPDATQRQLAVVLGVPLGKLNYCLKTLVTKGWIKAGNFTRSPDNRGYAYLLTPHGFEAKARLTVQFLQYKMREYERLQREIVALQEEVNSARPPV